MANSVEALRIFSRRASYDFPARRNRGLAFIRSMFCVEILRRQVQKDFAYKIGTRNIDFLRDVMILVHIFKIERHSTGI